MIAIPTLAAHESAIENLLDACFGKQRKQRTAYAIRHGSKPIKNLSFVIAEGDNIIGSIACSSILLKNDTKCIAMIMVGPIAISPDHQNIGLGKLLMETVFNVAQNDPNHAERPLFLIGDLEYYSRFGFINMPQNEWTLPGPFERERLLIRSKHKLPNQGEISAIGAL